LKKFFVLLYYGESWLKLAEVWLSMSLFSRSFSDGFLFTSSKSILLFRADSNDIPTTFVARLKLNEVVLFISWRFFFLEKSFILYLFLTFSSDIWEGATGLVMPVLIWLSPDGKKKFALVCTCGSLMD
jgi:hypothetical protein